VAGELHQGMHGQERLRGAIDDLMRHGAAPFSAGPTSSSHQHH
jgi:hypothetical protein